MKKDKQLQKRLRPIDVWGIALGAIIGWGCFVLPGNTFLPQAGPIGSSLGLLIGALLMIVISISYGYLIKKYPVSGGEYVYALESFGSKHAFVCGWFMILAYWTLIPLNATALALISRYLFPGVIQQGLLYSVQGWDVYAGEVVVASVFLVLMAIVNIVGIKKAAWIQTAISLLLVATIFLITSAVMLGFPSLDNLSPAIPNGVGWSEAIFAIVAISPWAYIGFDCIPQMAEEYKFSHKHTLLLMILAILVAALLYVMVNLVTAIVLPWQEFIASKPFWATGQAVEMSIGKIGLVLLGLAMFCAVVAGMNAFYISTSRLMYAMSKSGALPKYFSKLHDKYNTPHRALFWVMIISLSAPWFGREVLGWIVEMTSVGASIVFAYTTAAAIKMATKEGDNGVKYSAIAGFILSLFFLVLLTVPGMPGFLSLQSWIPLIIWVLMGLVFYLFMKRHKHHS